MKVWLRVFGCRANQYDGEQARAMLLRAGHEIVDSRGYRGWCAMSPTRVSA